jgi:hypothetical protein
MKAVVRPITCTATLVTALALASAEASAEPPSEAQAVARELFYQGRAHMEHGEYKEACEKFAESERLDPGGGTILNLAICHEALGKTASAWIELLDALRMATLQGRTDRQALAREHLQSIERRLSRLRIEVPEEARVEGLEIKLNGTELGAPAWGNPVPVDPGEQTIEASAPGKITWSDTITVGPDGDVRTSTCPVLEDKPALAAPIAIADEKPPPATISTEQVAGFAIGATAVTALVVGGVFGVRAMGLKSDVDRECPSPSLCSLHAFEANDDARRAANIATAAFAVGIVGVTGALYLLLVEHGNGS